MDAFTLTAATFGGLINEDVMQKITDLSQRIDKPFTDMTSEGSSSHPRGEWTIDILAAADLTNKFIDGEDTIANDDSSVGTRVSNFHTISTKTVKVSTRADATDTIGRAIELAYQISQRLKELRRDVEAQLLDQNASVAGVAATTASESAGVFAWLTTNTFRGATGADGGFQTDDGLVDAPTLGTARALTETLIRDATEAVYNQGGNPETLMAMVTVIRKLSEYMFTSSARIATLESNVSQGGPATAIAQGSVNVFVTDFGVTLKMVPNRLQPESDTAVSNVGIFDMSLLERSFLHGFRNEALAKSGLSEIMQLAVDWQLRVLNEAGCAVIADVDNTEPVVA